MNDEGFFQPYEERRLQSQPGVEIKKIDFSSFGGKVPEEEPELANRIEVKTSDDGKKTYCMPYKLRFEIPAVSGGTKIKHLAYFVLAHIDLEELLLSETALGAVGDTISLPDNVQNTIVRGPISSQVVIRDGTINNFAQIFYETPQDGSTVAQAGDYGPVWLGEVHYHGSENPGPNGYIGYMGGPPGKDMGPYLTAVPVLNGIIQDFREVKELEKINFDYSLFSNSWFNQKTTENLQNNLNGIKQLANRDNPYLDDTQDIEKAIVKSLGNGKNKSVFTQFYTSMDAFGNTRFFVGLDLKEVLKQNSAFPKLIEQVLEYGTVQEKNSFINKKKFIVKISRIIFKN